MRSDQSNLLLSRGFFAPSGLLWQLGAENRGRHSTGRLSTAGLVPVMPRSVRDGLPGLHLGAVGI
jgi:hypothetical protein